MIIMIMREQHKINWREMVERRRWWHDSLWPCPRHRRAALGKNRVRENIAAGELNQRRGMADPHHGEMRAIVAEPGAVVFADGKMILSRLERRFAISPIALPLQKILEAARLEAGIGIAEGVFVVRRRVSGLRLKFWL